MQLKKFCLNEESTNKDAAMIYAPFLDINGVTRKSRWSISRLSVINPTITVGAKTQMINIKWILAFSQKQ